MVKKHDIQYIRFVTDGSSARKAEAVRPQPKTQLPPVRKKRVTVIRLDPLAMLGILMSVVMLVLMLVSILQLSSLQQQTTQMYRYVKVLEEENARLNDKYTQNCDLFEIRRQALALGMIPVEQATHMYVSLPDNQQTQTGAGTMLVSGLE